MEFKYQTIFTCSVPESVKVLKDFHEMLASDASLTSIERLEIIKKSFEEAGLQISDIQITDDGMQAFVKLDDVHKTEEILTVNMRERPSLVVGNQIFKLEEFDV